MKSMWPSYDREKQVTSTVLSDFELFMHNLWWECIPHTHTYTIFGIINNNIYYFNGNPADIFPPSWCMMSWETQTCVYM